MTTRLTRAEQVERNHELVLEAAQRVLLARGYAGATLEAIAREAGFSRGVVYSQFASKADLVLELLERRITERAEHNAALAAAGSGREGLRALLRSNAARDDASHAWGRLLIEFRVHAARDPELNRRYAALHEQSISHFTDAIAALLDRGGVVPERPPRVIAELVFSLAAGHTLEQAAGTARLGHADLEDAVERLVGPPPSPRHPPGDPR